MADDAQKIELFYNLNAKQTNSFCYANRYGTKEKSLKDFFEFF